MTPHLVSAGAFESNLDPFTVNGTAHRSQLHTSPEMAMKQVLAATGKSIYQICRTFRDDPQSPYHAPEFTMLEFYCTHGDYETLVKQSVDLVQFLAEKSVPTKQISVRDLLLKTAEFDLLEAQTLESMRAAAGRVKDFEFSPQDSWSDIFFRLVLEKLEPSFDPDLLTVLTHYPVPVSPLSAVDVKTGFANRFELYWKGMEIANGCEELSCPEELKNRYEIQSSERVKAGKPPHPFPISLYQALVRGLPPVSGIAFGLERLFMAIHGMSTIGETVISLPKLE